MHSFRLTMAIAVALLAMTANASERGPRPEAPAFEQVGAQGGVRLSLDVQISRDGQSNRIAGSRSAAETSAPRSTRATFRSTGNDEVPKLAQGELLEVCFSSSHAGWVTLWDSDAENNVTPIYPNQFAPAQPGRRGVQVEADQRRCVGGKGDAFQLRLHPPLGVSNIVLYWTESDEDQFATDMFVDLSRSFRSARAAGRTAASVRSLPDASVSTVFHYELIRP